MRAKDFIVCANCGKEVLKEVRRINEAAKRGSKQVCSAACREAIKTTAVTKSCEYCGNLVTRVLSQAASSKTGHIFCNHTCAAKYNNTHKIIGTRRSKLEVWLEQQLIRLYPTLDIHFNRKDTINSELDIYIPSLNLAFELNGIFHYEPIYGQDKLDSILNNDDRKFQACLEHGIELCIIDSSKQKRFTEKSSKPFLEIITTLITSKLTN